MMTKPSPAPWNPWEELEKLQAETSKLWEAFLKKLSRSEASPADRLHSEH